MDTDLCLRRPFRGPQGTGVFGGGCLGEPDRTGDPVLVPDGLEDQRESWMGTLQIPALARGNKPHIVQSEGAEGQGRGSPWLQTQREGTQSGGRGTDPFPRREGRRLGVAEASLLAPGASCQDCEPLNPEFPVVKLRVPKPPASAPQGTGRFRTGLQGPFLRPPLAQARSCLTPQPSANPPQIRPAQVTPSPVWTLPSALLLAFRLPAGASQDTRVHLGPSLETCPGCSPRGPAAVRLLPLSGPAPGRQPRWEGET